jgi:DNA-directed RNA polymerase subunit RPC12/RpoP
VENVAEKAQTDAYEVTCPHCHKQFTADLIAGNAERYRGFKCPHCKLFVPAERAPEIEPAETA